MQHHCRPRRCRGRVRNREFFALQSDGKFAGGDRTIRPCNAEVTNAFDHIEHHLIAPRLQNLTCGGLTFLDNFVGGREQRAARHVERARAAGAAAVHPVGVALLDGDAVERHAEFLRDELREGRLVALPVRLRADIEFDAAILGEFHARPVRCRSRR